MQSGADAWAGFRAGRRRGVRSAIAFPVLLVMAAFLHAAGRWDGFATIALIASVASLLDAVRHAQREAGFRCPRCAHAYFAQRRWAPSSIPPRRCAHCGLGLYEHP